MTETKLKKNKEGYGYKYTDLSAIHDYLEEQGLRYYQFIERIDCDDYIMTVKIDANGNEGKPIRGSRVVDATLNGIKNPAQEQGSALTYARRYSLLMAYGLATEDDDAASLTRPVNKPVEKKISPKQIEVLEKTYKGDNLTKLLEANKLDKLEDMSMTKANEIIKKLMEKKGE